MNAKKKPHQPKSLVEKIKHKEKILFAIILIIAFSLRASGISIGLPNLLNPEEVSILNNIFYSPIFGNCFIANLLSASPEKLFIFLRNTGLIFGIASLIVFYLIGRSFNVFCALFSCLLLSISFIHVRFSQTFLFYIILLFFSLLSCYLTIQAYEKKSQKALIAATVFASISTLINYTGIANFVSILITASINKSLNKILRLFFVTVLILSAFYMFQLPFTLKNILENFTSGYRDYQASSLLLCLNIIIGSIGPIAIFSALMLPWFKNNFDKTKLKIIYSIPLIYLGLIVTGHFTKQGYILLLVPFICLAASLVIYLFFNYLFGEKHALESDNKQIALKYFFIVILLLTTWIPLKYTFRYKKLISLADTRVLATEWVKENTTREFKIAHDKNSIQLNWFDVLDKKFVKDLNLEPDTLDGPQIFNLTQDLLKKKNWHKILKKKVDYVIINSFDYEEVLRKKEQSPMNKFYRKFLISKPIIVFNPYYKDYERRIRKMPFEDLYFPMLTLWERERCGPVIKIYKL